MFVQGVTSYTKEDGTFSFSHLHVPDNRFHIICEKGEYFPAVKAATPIKEGKIAFTLYLMSDQVSHTISASTGGIATLEIGSGVEFPPDDQISMTVSHKKGTRVIVFRTPVEGTHQVGAVDICVSQGLGENSFVLNGGEFDNAERILQPDRGDHYASYHQQINITTVLVLDQSDTLSMSFQLIGKSVGELSGDKVLLGLVARRVAGKWKNCTTDEFIGGALEIEITSYEDKNGKVEGNFDGIFIDELGIRVEVKVKFSTIRTF